MSRRLTMKSFFRIRTIRNIFFLLLIALLCRLYIIQMVDGEELHMMAMEQYAVTSEAEPLEIHCL